MRKDDGSGTAKEASSGKSIGGEEEEWRELVDSFILWDKQS